MCSALAEIAFVAQGSQVIDDSAAASYPGDYVIDVQVQLGMRCRGATAGDAAEAVPLQDEVPKGKGSFTWASVRASP